MPALRFRDRFFTKPVARAVTSPSAIVAAGAGAAIGIVAFAPFPPLGAVVGALAAYAARVAFAVPRKQGGEHIDPFALGEPWRQFVQAALQARNRFGEAVRTMQPGPLRDHLTEIGGRLDDGVDECWRAARRGQLLTDARKNIDDIALRRELAQVGSEQAQPPAPGTTGARVLEALQAQLATGARMDAVLADTFNRLRLLDARRDETVTRAIELSVQTAPEDLSGLDDDVDGIVTEMEAVRQALDDAGRRSDFPDLGPAAVADAGTGAPPAAERPGTTSPPATSPPSPPPPPPPGRSRPA